MSESDETNSADVGERIAQLRRQIPLLDPDESDRGLAAMELAQLLGAEWCATPDEARWHGAVTELDAIRAPVVPRPSFMTPLYDLALGILWYTRAWFTEDSEDESEACRLLEAARNSVKVGAGVPTTASSLLGSLRYRTAATTHDDEALEGAILDLRIALSSRRGLPADATRARFYLAQALWHRYRRALSRDDLAEALSLAIESVDDQLLDEERVSQMHGLLGILYGEAYEKATDDELASQLLDLSISEHEVRLAHKFDDRAVEATAHDNAGNAYARRYERSKDPDDLDAAIRESRVALDLSAPGAEVRGRIWCNLSASLVDRARDRGDFVAAEEAAHAARSGLGDGIDAPDVRPRLVRQLAKSLLVHQAMLNPSESSTAVFDEATDLLEEALRDFLTDESVRPVSYRLGTRTVLTRVQAELVGLLLGRADSPDTTGLVNRAFCVAEAAKAPLLTADVLRRELTPPAELDESTARWESELAGTAAGLDIRELLDDGTEPLLSIRVIHKRRLHQGELNDVWAGMAAITSADVRRYAWLKCDPVRGLQDSLGTRPPGYDLVSVVTRIDVDTSGNDTTRMNVLLLRDGAPDAEVLCETEEEVFVDALRAVDSLATEQSAASESGFEPLVSALATAQQHSSERVAVSPTTDTFGLPWQMLFTRAGWRTADGRSTPVFVIPGQTLCIADLAGNPYAVTEDLDFVRRMRLQDPDDVGKYIRLTGPDPPRATVGAVVLGNPTGDLGSSEDEAGDVARLLGVPPLIREAAKRDAVLDAVEDAATVHVAAHVLIDPGNPLRSTVELADGPVAAAQLLSARGATELVVLSGCHSGYGRPMGGGELASFATVLLRAGAYAVVTSGWPVDDAATAYLMAGFHRRHLAGESVAVALAEAAADVAEQPGWSSPYYWAAFTLTQQGRD